MRWRPAPMHPFVIALPSPMILCSVARRVPSLAPAFLVSALAAALASPGARAAETEEADGRWAAGLGGGASKSVYAGVGTRQAAFPFLSYEGRWLRLSGNQADLKWLPGAPLEVSLRLQLPVAEGYKASDSPALAGMAERKADVLAGVALRSRNQPVDLSLSWLRDVSGHSHGSTWKLGVERALPLGPGTSLVPHLAWLRLNDRHVDYYYGVSSREATATRRAFQGSATTAVEAGLKVNHALAPEQWLFVDLSLTRFGPGVTRSPIVARAGQPRVLLGYAHAF